MSTNTSWRKLTASALALILASASTVADSTVTVAADLSGGAAADTADAVNLPDPPGRVGRLSFMEGTVSFHAAEQTQWSPATLNFPVTSGDSFWTEPNSKAEIQVGPAEIRMDQRSEIDVVRIDDDATQIALRQGHVNLHLPVLPEGGVEVLTAHGKVMLTQAGRYRIDAGRMTGDRPADRIQVSVLDGEARIDASSGTRVIAAGESVFASGEPVAFTLTTAQADAFDDWARSREPVPAAAAPAAAAGNAAPPIVWNGGRVTPTGPSQTLNYVSPEMTGYQDLDGYGTWATAADYGPLWYPSRVQAGWAPYRYGHWAFVAPWGWTWIDDQPWGFAPFHYGRWVLVHDRWGWCPGSFARRPVYAPALVAFIGGDDWGITIALGHTERAVGWVPLAPHEVFRPYYHASPRYVRNVNVTNVSTTVINNINITNVTNVTTAGGATAASFRNARGATVVRTDAFTNAAPVGTAALAVPREQIAQARVAQRLDRFRPSRAARAGIAVPAAALAAKSASDSTSAAVDRAAETAVPESPGPAIERNRGGDDANARAQFARRGDRQNPAQAKPDATASRDSAPGPQIQNRDAPARAARSGPRSPNIDGGGNAAAQSPANPAPDAAPDAAPGPAIIRGGFNRSADLRSRPAQREARVPAAVNDESKATAPAPTPVAENAPAASAPSQPQPNPAPGPAIVRGGLNRSADMRSRPAQREANTPAAVNGESKATAPAPTPVAENAPAASAPMQAQPQTQSAPRPAIIRRGFNRSADISSRPAQREANTPAAVNGESKATAPGSPRVQRNETRAQPQTKPAPGPAMIGRGDGGRIAPPSPIARAPEPPQPERAQSGPAAPSFGASGPTSSARGAAARPSPPAATPSVQAAPVSAASRAETRAQPMPVPAREPAVRETVVRERAAERAQPAAPSLRQAPARGERDARVTQPAPVRAEPQARPAPAAQSPAARSPAAVQNAPDPRAANRAAPGETRRFQNSPARPDAPQQAGRPDSRRDNRRANRGPDRD